MSTATVHREKVDAYIFTMRPYKRDRKRCPYCEAKCSGYDRTGKRRMWRGLDINGKQAYIEGEICRVKCPEHGVVTARVPWGDIHSQFTRAFESTVAWLAQRLSKTDVATYMGIDWETVGRCISRVKDRLEPDPTVRYAGLRYIGIDETSYKKGHKYLLVVVNHETNEVVWAHKGYGKEVLDLFFKELTPEQKAGIEVVTGDGAKWITSCVAQHCPNATRCMDCFHVVEWINESLNDVKVDLARKARKDLRRLEQEEKKQNQVKKESAAAAIPQTKEPAKPGRPKKEESEQHRQARQAFEDLQSSMYPLLKNPENLTKNQ